jgi:hypothetical protein
MSALRQEAGVCLVCHQEAPDWLDPEQAPHGWHTRCRDWRQVTEPPFASWILERLEERFAELRKLDPSEARTVGELKVIEFGQWLRRRMVLWPVCAADTVEGLGYQQADVDRALVAAGIRPIVRG